MNAEVVLYQMKYLLLAIDITCLGSIFLSGNTELQVMLLIFYQKEN
ncbi:hypothetical protein ACJDTP_16005 [Clostridium sp. WILCCON 0112]|uniref:Uncharacterized protein n=1 Tax=Candidatus Clostridium helianthi TaxID=3381660 RepID=A0ABW8S8Q2_9CLOT